MPINTAIIVPHPPLLIPEVGRGQERRIMDTINGFRKAVQAIAEQKPETIILISPHAPAYADYIHISSGREKVRENLHHFGGLDEIEAEVDQELALAISQVCEKEGIPAGTEGTDSYGNDHATFVPLYFLNQCYTDYQLVVCSLSGLPRAVQYQFGTCIRKAVEKTGRKAAVVASGDLSHRLKKEGPYGFAKEGPELDKQLIDIMKSGKLKDFLNVDKDLCREGAECGLGSFITMAGMLDGRAIQSEFLSYEGSFGVGYAVCIFYVQGGVM